REAVLLEPQRHELAPRQAQRERAVGGARRARAEDGLEECVPVERHRAAPRIGDDLDLRARNGRAVLAHDDAEDVEIAVCVRKVSTGTSIRFATSATGKSSNQRKSTVERYGSSRSSTSRARNCCASASATSSSAVRGASRSGARASWASRRPAPRRAFLATLR